MSTPPPPKPPIAPPTTDTYQFLDTTLTNYKLAYAHYLDKPECSTDPNNANGKCPEFTTLQTLDASFQAIMTQYTVDSSNNYGILQDQAKTNSQLREDLDQRMAQLEQHPALTDSQMFLDTSIFAGVAWTILASGILYYVFVEL